MPGLGDGPGHPAEDAVHEAALLQLGLQLGLVVLALAHPPEDLEDAVERAQVDQAERQQEGAGDGDADQAGRLVQGGAVLLDLARQRADAEGEQGAEAEDDRRVAQREPEADRQRALALAHQLAGGVVDGGDVVGVEGVPHAERVRGEPHAGAEDLAADVVVLGRDDREQGEPADHVQREDEAAHTCQADPLLTGEPVAPAGAGHRGSFRGAVAAPGRRSWAIFPSGRN